MNDWNDRLGGEELEGLEGKKRSRKIDEEEKGRIKEEEEEWKNRSEEEERRWGGSGEEWGEEGRGEEYK
jgi:hypothetical protein